jgi:hypothetical protein
MNWHFRVAEDVTDVLSSYRDCDYVPGCKEYDYDTCSCSSCHDEGKITRFSGNSGQVVDTIWHEYNRETVGKVCCDKPPNAMVQGCSTGFAVNFAENSENTLFKFCSCPGLDEFCMVGDPNRLVKSADYVYAPGQYNDFERDYTFVDSVVSEVGMCYECQPGYYLAQFYTSVLTNFFTDTENVG